MRVGTSLVGATLGLGLSLALGASAQAAPILLAEGTGASGITWVAALAPSPGTVNFSYRIRENPGSTTEYLTSTYDAATPVPIDFDLSGAALAATIAALQDGVIHDYQFWSTGPDRFDGSGPIRTISQIFDTFDLPDLTPFVIGSVRISLFQVCVRGVGEICATPLVGNSGLANEISARVRMSIFSDDPGGEPEPVPEPGTIALLTTGAVGLIAMARRRQDRR